MASPCPNHPTLQFLEASDVLLALRGGFLLQARQEYADRGRWRTDRRLSQLLQDMDEARANLKDPEMAELAEEEWPRLKPNCHGAEAKFATWHCLPRDEADKKPAMLEIRPGTGGERSGVVAADLLRSTNVAEAQAGKSILIETAVLPNLAA